MSDVLCGGLTILNGIEYPCTRARPRAWGTKDWLCPSHRYPGWNAVASA